MANSVHRCVKALIEETNDAYGMFTAHGNMNGDYADFASLSLSQFKAALRKPEMTRRELVRLLRKASNSHKDVSPDACWANFMAGYMAKTSNSNTNNASS